jgi:hypothetical protein
MIMASLNPSLGEQLEAIRSHEDLAGFVRDLSHDFQANPGDWENRTLETYLEALAAWVDDCEGYYQNKGEALPKDPNWKFLGQALSAAKVYE